ncbi:PfkB family carbohydrate kinase [Microbacterium oryzae]|uniref:PfkB family carbohydrate kinase n=1 Tax=Microbacterium oryzae TaxID=743009 RepID=UPI0025B090F5|nr:PfkB family carbohydrate kinase [Microbacterium oryzae]MDN3310614.1 PfkB family carbohydrate kinase [Microbacterium oryzae]
MTGAATGPARVLGVGDNVIDRFLDRGVYYPGGNSVNVAVFARRAGAEAAYLGVFGDDDPGSHIRGVLGELGIATDHSVVRAGETGWCDVRVVDGDRVFGDWSGGVTVERPIELTSDVLAYASGFDLVHVSAYAALEPQLPALHPAARLLVFDFSDEPEYREDGYRAQVAPWTDLAVLSAAQLPWTEAEDLARDTFAKGARMVLLTRGLEGSAVFDGDGFVRAAAVRVETVDTMGCGDAFIASFMLSAHAAGWSRGRRLSPAVLEAALHDAAKAAAEQCAVEGAFGYPKEYVQ